MFKNIQYNKIIVLGIFILVIHIFAGPTVLQTAKKSNEAAPLYSSKVSECIFKKSPYCITETGEKLTRVEAIDKVYYLSRMVMAGTYPPSGKIRGVDNYWLGAKNLCEQMGKGVRLPTVNDVDYLKAHAKENGYRFENGIFWTSIEYKVYPERVECNSLTNWYEEHCYKDEIYNVLCVAN